MPLLFRDSTYYIGTPREVSEYGHFVFFLPIIEEPCVVVVVIVVVVVVVVDVVGRA